MTADTTEAMWDSLQEMGVSEQTLQVVANIEGYSTETMESVLYAFCGYRSFDQLEEEDDV